MMPYNKEIGACEDKKRSSPEPNAIFSTGMQYVVDVIQWYLQRGMLKKVLLS
jgi:hypothetical protein